MRDQNRILIEFFDFIVSQVVCIAFRNHVIDQTEVNIFRKQQCVPVVFQPFCKVVIGNGNLHINFPRNLNLFLSTEEYQPMPEFRYSLNGIVVTVRVYKDIGVKQIQQTYRS